MILFLEMDIMRPTLLRAQNVAHGLTHLFNKKDANIDLTIRR